MSTQKEMNDEDLKKKIEECEKLKNEYLSGWQRERADFLNYKKDEMERIAELIKYAGSEFILKALPILDNFEIAEKKLPEDLKEDKNVNGLLLVKKQVLDFLKNLGLESIDCLGKKFDPNFMEAVEQVETKDKESGIIVEETQRGYLMRGKILRPAKVKVAK